MNPEKVLSNEQIEQFHRDGFLLVRGMYSTEEVQAISDRTEEVAGFPEVPGKYMMYFDESRAMPYFSIPMRRTARIPTARPRRAGCFTLPTTGLQKAIRGISTTRTNARIIRRISNGIRIKTIVSRFETSQETRDGKHSSARFTG